MSLIMVDKKQMDRLARVVLPSVARKLIDLKPYDKVRIYADEENKSIIIQKENKEG